MKTSKPRPGHAPAFTLIELLTVIAIIGVLAGIMIPVLSSVRQKARDVDCINNLRQLGAATGLYAEEHKGAFPVGRGNTNYVYELMGGYIAIPGGLIKVASNRRSPFICQRNVASATGTISNAVCQTYAMNGGVASSDTGTAIKKYMHNVPAPSRTCLFGDGLCSGTGWELIMNASGNNSEKYKKPGYVHDGKCHFVFVDGHVASLPPPYPDSGDVFWTPQ
ncbi:MAG: type II secretion system GspH family protein [Opitutaceae bacterium]|jgi:general secretion pathway protein G|nr:type II secretion system GspH family protein [Opitutaceae bacterium]